MPQDDSHKLVYSSVIGQILEDPESLLPDAVEDKEIKIKSYSKEYPVVDDYENTIAIEVIETPDYNSENGGVDYICDYNLIEDIHLDPEQHTEIDDLQEQYDSLFEQIYDVNANGYDIDNTFNSIKHAVEANEGTRPNEYSLLLKYKANEDYKKYDKELVKRLSTNLPEQE